ncbi:MAG TPA: 50S ribosomal protein L17 [Candidatus Peribacterales bacterium]|nr:50S ribosomal protein L17 [Candidatus Peribacterales bacterium]
MTLSPRTSLGRKPAPRRMLVRNLVTSLLLYEKVRTTHARAKAIQPMIDRLITKAKKRPPHIAARFINQIVTHRNAAQKVFEVFVDRYKDRPSGFTRMKPLGLRKGDGAKLVEISLVDSGLEPETPKKKPSKKPSQKS